MAVGGPVFDSDPLVIDTGLTQPLPESGDIGGGLRSPLMKESDNKRWLLCLPCKRDGGRAGAQQANELAPLQSFELHLSRPQRCPDIINVWPTKSASSRCGTSVAAYVSYGSFSTVSAEIVGWPMSASTP